VRVRSERGDTKGALETAQAQLLRAEATGDTRSIATAHASLGLALVLADAPAEAAGHYEAARERAVALGDVVLEVHVVSDLAGCCHALGDYAGCLRLLAEARRAADKIGYRRHLVYNLTNEAQLRCTLGDEGAQACAAVAVQRSLELDDPGTASDALHTWLSARPGLAGSAAQHWARLVRLDTALGRYGAAAEGGAELALVLARGGHRDAACTAAADALSIAGDLDLPRVLRRSRLARLLAECPRRKSGGRAYGPAVLDGLVALAADDDADEIDRAELAMDRWRTTRTDADRESAVEALRAAFQSEPSLCVRAWFKELKEQPPPAPILLAPPIGIGRVRTTRAQLDDALWQVESAVFGKRQPRRAITRLREPEPEAVE
jgi:hypothetical protein